MPYTNLLDTTTLIDEDKLFKDPMARHCVPSGSAQWKLRQTISRWPRDSYTLDPDRS